MDGYDPVYPQKIFVFGKIKMTAIVHKTDIVGQLFVFPNPIMRSSVRNKTDS